MRIKTVCCAVKRTLDLSPSVFPLHDCFHLFPATCVRAYVRACVGACVCVFERGSEKEREGEITCIIVVFLIEVLLYLILRY